MTTTNHSDGAESPAAEPSQLLKTDVLGRTRMSQAQREAILDAFEASAMKPGVACVMRESCHAIYDDPFVRPFPQPAMGLFVLWGGCCPRAGAMRSNPGLCCVIPLG